ncbi:PREDICTED: melanotransferrin isoform X2 [Nanorana parkeri]|uniref:melanotransferrin isoform X2 n=1 Tax=Nanorana parkeri TaxID=125878 RepID=UPI00085429E7|nr:PREDICTED: melanotransferrin isoform X2 [Nanorana parkeri]
MITKHLFIRELLEYNSLFLRRNLGRAQSGAPGEMAGKSWIFFFCIIQTICCLSEIKWCTISEPELQKCSEMKKYFTQSQIVPPLSCVAGNSSMNCAKMVKDNLADAVVLDSNFIYKAGKQYNLKPVVAEVYDQGMGTSYYAVVVVRKNSTITINSLKGTKSCHTGLQKTAGWNVPIGLLIDSGRMSAVACDIQKGVASFFSKSCVPGANKALYPSLCELCKGDGTGQNVCLTNGTELYQDYDGAFRCLVEGGDVAFVKHSTVHDNSDGLNSAPWARDVLSSDYQLLCRDGTRASVGEWRRCNLVRVPARAVVVRPDVDSSLIYKTLHEGQQKYNDFSVDFKMFDSSAYGGRNLIFRDATTELRPISNQTYQAWLGDEFLQAMTGIDCDPDKLPKSLRWCSIKTEEVWKCADMAMAFKNKTLYPSIQCVSAENHEECMRMIQQKNIDAVTLDGGDIYTAGKMYGLVPAAAESYSVNETSNNYYVVAVVRKNPYNAFTIHELKGKKSCHTEYMDTAGWNVPIGILKRHGLIRPEGCNIAKAVSDFFTESCVPGMKQKQFPSNLCQLCIGDKDGGNKCENKAEERYYGHTGAFRCLTEKGDVAFVKHTTVFENSDGKNQDDWAKNLKSSDFQLLCPNGARAEVTQYEDCNWAHVPAQAVMVHPDTNRHALFGLLDKAQEYYGRDSSSEFKMFDSSYYNQKDLIFKDSTDKIVPVQEKKTYDEWLGRNYIESVEGLQCSSSNALTTLNIALLLISTILLISFSA